MLPRQDIIDWQFDVWSWLLRHLDGFEQYDQNQILLLPTAEHFPVDDFEDHDLAQAIFDIVRTSCGMSDWPCQLQPHDEIDISEAMSSLPLSHTSQSGAAGTISSDGSPDSVVITYNSQQLDDPMSLVVTFAHELSHYLTESIRETPPGGDEAWEPATDICAVYLGFGVFMANAAFSYQGYSNGMLEGWSVSRQGYLTEVDLAYALAIFAGLLDVPLEEFRSYLDPNPCAYVKKAQKDIQKRRQGRLAALRAVKLQE